jgi:quercetin dioxygenase-like cupin family protein
MSIARSGGQSPTKGSEQYFTGAVEVTPLFPPHEPSRTSGGFVKFECCARSAWHTHPLGQTLVVTEGMGLVQEWGKPARKIQKGDVVWTPPGVKHWHGATALTSVSHIAIQEFLNGKNVEWLEKVSDEQYQAADGEAKAPEEDK